MIRILCLFLFIGVSGCALSSDKLDKKYSCLMVENKHDVLAILLSAKNGVGKTGSGKTGSNLFNLDQEINLMPFTRDSRSLKFASAEAQKTNKV